MPLRREQVAEYHRKRRARLKREKAAKPRAPKDIPLGRPLNAKERRDNLEMEAIEARGGSPQWDVAKQRWYDEKALPASPPVSQAVAVYRPPADPSPKPPPRSMIACGGRPPGAPVRASAAEATAAWRARTEGMLQVLAARVDANTREIAELKAAAAKREPPSLAQAFLIALRDFGR
jgi:hypothetical protein